MLSSLSEKPQLTYVISGFKADNFLRTNDTGDENLSIMPELDATAAIPLEIGQRILQINLSPTLLVLDIAPNFRNISTEAPLKLVNLGSAKPHFLKGDLEAYEKGEEITLLLDKEKFNTPFLKASMLAVLKLTYGNITFDGSKLLDFNGLAFTQAAPPSDYAQFEVALGDSDVLVTLKKGSDAVLSLGNFDATVTIDRKALTEEMEKQAKNREIARKLFSRNKF